MTRYTLPLLAVAAISVPAAAAEVQIQAGGPVVELSVSESVKARPDMVTIGAGVTSRAPTAVAAMQQNAKDMTAVVDRIKALGIPKEDIQTTGINLNAQYQYDQARQQQVFTGYQASNRVSVTLRKVEDAGKVLDALVAAGATDLDGPNFGLEDDEAAQAQARKAAMQRANAQALEYAQLAGYSGVRLLEVSEATYSRAPVPLAVRAQSDAAFAPATPVEPGQVATSVNITVKFEMTR